MFLIQLATAPVCVGIFYIYIRDKYEKEPWRMLLAGLVYGIIMTAVIYGIGVAIEEGLAHQETDFYTSFVSSAGVEEGIKFLFFMIFIWRNKNFNEPMDGIVYCVFLSLGFAWIENIIYVVHPLLGGYETALSRAVLSVPGHGLFGLQMGYYLGLAKFERKKRYFVYGFLLAYLSHALYNYFLLADDNFFWIPFWGLEIWLWWNGAIKIKKLLSISPFRGK